MADDLNFDFEVQLNARDAVNRELNKVRKMGHDSSMAQMAQSNGNAPRHGKSNFRQIVCRHWLRGLCMKGDDCTFLHQVRRCATARLLRLERRREARDGC